MTTYVVDNAAAEMPVREQDRPMKAPAEPYGEHETRRRPRPTANVDQVLDDSFPASDPPSWTSAISRVASTPEMRRMATDQSTAPDDIGTRAFRLRPIMRQGTASSVPETWTTFPSVDEARAGAKHMYHDDRVLRVMLVVNGTSSFVEWIER